MAWSHDRHCLSLTVSGGQKFRIRCLAGGSAPVLHEFIATILAKTTVTWSLAGAGRGISKMCHSDDWQMGPSTHGHFHVTAWVSSPYGGWLSPEQWPNKPNQKLQWLLWQSQKPNTITAAIAYQSHSPALFHYGRGLFTGLGTRRWGSLWTVLVAGYHSWEEDVILGKMLGWTYTRGSCLWWYCPAGKEEKLKLSIEGKELWPGVWGTGVSRAKAQRQLWA